VIELEHVGHAFVPPVGRVPLPVLDDVDLAVPDGAFVSVVGPTGCGKTTLLRIVHGLLRPTSGRVVIDGRPVTGPSADRAMVFQEFNLLPWRNARHNVELGLEVQGADRARRRAAADAALRLVGLAGFEEHYPHQLSGGMKQRLGLARALCTAPRYLLMDEPFGALDLQTRELMQVELSRLWERDRKTVLFVTHSVDEAVFLSDRVVVLSARPARVLQVIDVRLPRPRGADDRELRATAAFAEHGQRVRHLLRQEQPEAALAGVGPWR
jgi:ABC-type nitrate/sulfonate/bicarbonate transport system ATPase subunit